jgi:predicted secreted protein
MTTSAVSGASGGLYISANKVAEATNLRLTIDGKEIDVTSVDSAGWTEIIGGRRSWQVSGDFNLIVGDTNGFIALQTALLAGTTVATVKARSTAAGYNWSGTVLVTQANLDLANPGDKQQTVSWTLKGTGAITPAAS